MTQNSSYKQNSIIGGTILRKRQISGQKVAHKTLKQWKQNLRQFAELTTENKDGEK